MRLRTLASMISTANDYSLLKWPLLINSVLITLLAFMLLLSFQSNSWFTYESFDIDKDLAKLNLSIKSPNTFEYSTFGLWLFCTEQYDDATMKCTPWVGPSRPQYFYVLTILITCTTLLANLAIFPSWAATILILYNLKNIYVRHIVVFQWIVFSFLLLLTCLNICAMILVGLTKYYSPGKFVSYTRFISFHTGPGLSYLLTATILSIICFILLIASLIWQKFIEMRLVEEEKELYRQLNEDNYTPGWNKVIMGSRDSPAMDDHYAEPPPYNPYYGRS